MPTGARSSYALRASQPRLCDRRLEQFDGIAGRVIDNDLFATDARHDVVPQVHAGSEQALNSCGEIIDLYGEAVPPAGLLLPAIGHGLAAAARRIRRAEHEPQVREAQHGERRRRMHVEPEAQVLYVEFNRGVDVADDVPHLNRCHRGRVCWSMSA